MAAFAWVVQPAPTNGEAKLEHVQVTRAMSDGSTPPACHVQVIPMYS
jgi:hypothetical protein